MPKKTSKLLFYLKKFVEFGQFKKYSPENVTPPLRGYFDGGTTQLHRRSNNAEL